MQPFWWFKKPVAVTEWITNGTFEESPIEASWDFTATPEEGASWNHTPSGNWGMYIAGTILIYLEQDILTLKGQACPVNDITVVELWYRNQSLYGPPFLEYFDVVITYTDDAEQTITVLMEYDTDWHDAGSIVLAALTAGKEIKKFRVQNTPPVYYLVIIDDIRISTA